MVRLRECPRPTPDAGPIARRDNPSAVWLGRPQIVANFDDEAEGCQEWHRLAGLARAEGFDVDDARIAIAVEYGTNRLRPGAPSPFSWSAVAFFVTTAGGPVVAMVHHRGGFPKHVRDEDLLFRDIAGGGDRPDTVLFLGDPTAVTE